MNGLILLSRRWVSHLWSGCLTNAWVWPFLPSHRFPFCPSAFCRGMMQQVTLPRCWYLGIGLCRYQSNGTPMLFLNYPTVIFSHSDAERGGQLSTAVLSAQGSRAGIWHPSLWMWELWPLLRITLSRSSKLCPGAYMLLPLDSSSSSFTQFNPTAVHLKQHKRHRQVFGLSVDWFSYLSKGQFTGYLESIPSRSGMCFVD